MKLFKLLYVLFKIKLLSPLGLIRLLSAFYTCGINIMALLHFAEKKYANQIALIDDHETITYKELMKQSERLAICLKQVVSLQSGQKVAFLCKNHASLVKAIFAVSRLGADIYFLNAEMSKNQFNNFVVRYDFDVLIYDDELSKLVKQSCFTKEKILSNHNTLPAISNFLNTSYIENTYIPRASTGKIILQTSGTTGAFKEASHKPSLFNYLNPFATFISRLKILNYHSSYISTPIYHGYGFAVLLLFIPLGKMLVISTGFQAKKACQLIRDHQIEVVTVVPLMLQRMLGSNPEALRSLKCIASGGAKLNISLIEETHKQLGSVLYNLYGTSESGLNFIATPQDLAISPVTIGKPINGMQIKVLNSKMHEVKSGEIGQLCIKNEWSMSNKNLSFIETGDLGYKDENGLYFLCGRKDDMIISGGENVYPIEVEKVLFTHPSIEDVAVVGISDEQFGQRLKAFVLLKTNGHLTEEELINWLRPKVARYQLPKAITFVTDMPYTPLGKLDKINLQKPGSTEK